MNLDTLEMSTAGFKQKGTDTRDANGVLLYRDRGQFNVVLV